MKFNFDNVLSDYDPFTPRQDFGQTLISGKKNELLYLNFMLHPDMNRWKQELSSLSSFQGVDCGNHLSEVSGVNEKI